MANKPDYTLIGIITVCILALGVLIWNTLKLINDDAPPQQEIITANDYERLEQDTKVSPTEQLDDEASDFEGSDQQAGRVPDDVPSIEEPTPTENLSDTQDSDTPDPNTIDTPSQNTQPDTRTYDNDRQLDGAPYLVLAGSYKYKSNAEVLAKRLHRMGYNSAKVELFNRGAYAVVLVDRFNALIDAKDLVKELAGKGVESRVMEKR